MTCTTLDIHQNEMNDCTERLLGVNISDGVACFPFSFNLHSSMQLGIKFSYLVVYGVLLGIMGS